MFTIKSPAHVHTKGSCKILVGKREVVIENSRRPQRVCGNCKKLGLHDKRTCPVKSFSSDADVSAPQNVVNELEVTGEENIDI